MYKRSLSGRCVGENSIAVSFKLLSRRDKSLIALVIVSTVIFGLLDLLGIMLVGAIGSISATTVSSGTASNRVSQLLEILGISSFSVQNQVTFLGIIAALILTFKTVISFIFTKKSLYFLARRSAVISSELVSKYFSLPISSINKRSAQESIYALTAGVNYLMVGVIGVWVTLISDFFLLIILGVGLFYIDKLTSIGVLVVFVSIATILHRLMHNKVKIVGIRQSKLNVIGSQKIFEAVNLFRELLVRDRRGYYAQQISKNRFELANGTAFITLTHNVSKYVLELVMIVSALLLAFYQFSVNSTSRAIAVVLVFVVASTRITPAVLRIQQAFLQIRNHMGQASPTISLIEELKDKQPIEWKFDSIPQRHDGFAPSVMVEGVTFGFNSSTKVLKNISFEIEPGEFIGIVGTTGAGKSTLMDVMLGALEPQIGNVLISGLPPVAAYSKWPGAVSYVPQLSTLIDGTIRENLTIGYPSSQVAEEICWTALSLASIDGFVRSLPDGLDTPVGDRGVYLSGGQRQRLGIARALVTNPKLLVLDEATSSLDSVTEREISDFFIELRGKVTIVVVAHRLSTIMEADRILFIKEGEIKGIGNFNELKKKSNEFRIQTELMGL